MNRFSLPQAQPFEMERGDHGVLLIHGFTGSPAHMRLIGEGLADAGFSVRGLLLPGHGTTPEEMRKVSWQDWLLAVRTAAREMRQKYRHFSVAGLSMGGALTLIMAQEMDLTACVPISAPYYISNPFRRLALPMAPFVPMLGRKGGEEEEVDPASYHIGYSRYPTKSVHDLSVLIDRVKRDMALVHCPVLVIQPKLDKTVRPISAEKIIANVSSRCKALLWLEKSPHVCTVGEEKDRVVQAMVEFLRKAEQEELTSRRPADKIKTE